MAVTFDDYLWLLSGAVLGVLGACAIPWGIDAVERLVRRIAPPVALRTVNSQKPVNDDSTSNPVSR